MNDMVFDIVSFGGYSMGIIWQVKLVVVCMCDLYLLYVGIQVQFDVVVVQMSIWEFGSDIVWFNCVDVGYWQVLLLLFDMVVQCVLDIVWCSGGVFDFIVGLLVVVWGFGVQVQVWCVFDVQILVVICVCCGWQCLWYEFGWLY